MRSLVAFAVVACGSPAVPAVPGLDDAPARVAVSPQSRSIIAGDRSCAVRHGQVWCWGDNRKGELGVSADGSTPVHVGGIRDAIGVAVGGNRTCSWSRTGIARCWDPASETRVLSPDHVVELALSRTDAGCARRDDGSVSCFDHKLVDTRIEIAHAVELAVGRDGACVRTTDARVLCWALEDREPAEVVVLRGATAIAMSRGDAVAGVVGDRVVETSPWIKGGQSATSTRAPPSTTRIAIGELATCALGPDVTCWTTDEPPHRMAGSDGAVDLAVGDRVACFRDARDRIACWGQAGLVGDGGHDTSAVPVRVTGVTSAVQLAGSNRVCVRQADGSVSCWGPPLHSQQPFAVYTRERDHREITDATPVPVAVPRARSLAVSASLACIQSVRDEVWCWGEHDSLIASPNGAPTHIAKLDGASWIMPVGRFVCGFVDGHARCESWYDFRFGSRMPASALRVLTAGYEIPCLENGDKLTCADAPAIPKARIDQLRARYPTVGLESDVVVTPEPLDPTVVAECTSRAGQLVVRVDGSVAWRDDRNWPTAGPLQTVAGIHDIVGITSVGDCLLNRDGRVSCGELSASKPPAWRVVDGIDDAVEIVGDYGFTCARRRTGAVMCWGTSDHLGNGSVAVTKTPSVLALEP